MAQQRKMSVKIALEHVVDVNEVIDLLKRSTLAERRNISDLKVYSTALRNSNIIITARLGSDDNNKLIGYTRCLTDFSTTCYIADIAVDEAMQHQHIGKQMMQYLEQILDKEVIFLLLSAPKAMKFYPKIGYKLYPRCFIKTSKL